MNLLVSCWLEVFAVVTAKRTVKKNQDVIGERCMRNDGAFGVRDTCRFGEGFWFGAEGWCMACFEETIQQWYTSEELFKIDLINLQKIYIETQSI